MKCIVEENVDLESETSSDESTWNLELPNISGINLDSDSENTGLSRVQNDIYLEIPGTENLYLDGPGSNNIYLECLGTKQLYLEIPGTKTLNI